VQTIQPEQLVCGWYKKAMQIVCVLIWLSGVYPLWQVRQANPQWSLLQGVYWMAAAWLTWGGPICLASSSSAQSAAAWTYLALVMSGCAGIAVLGARRPLNGPWNFVVLALAAVQLLPVAEGLATGGGLEVSTVRLMSLAATIGVGVLNYLPTRSAPAAILLLAGTTLTFIPFVFAIEEDHYRGVEWVGRLAVALVPWLAYLSVAGKGHSRSEFDELWLEFRDRFGFLWAQRLRDQFNRSAVHAGWPVVLRWQGLRIVAGAAVPSTQVQGEIVAALRALLKRFAPEPESSHLSNSERPV
jgi:hypothetical protein